MTTNMKFHDRPVTKDGMSGMNTKMQGPGRVVQDRSYFMTQIRQKCQQTCEEIEKMKNKMENMNKET